MATLADDPRSLHALKPVTPGERIAVLDILRGLALLGICVINVPGFYMPFYFKLAGETLYSAWHDTAAVWLVDFLGSGKFNSMFSFLFGIGFAIQLERAGARGAPFVGVYLRRLLALFAFGVAHQLLIWNGDVLHIYAILGLGLLLARKLRDRWLWLIAGLLLVSPMVYGAYELYRQEPDEHTPAYWRARAEDQLRIFGRGNYDALVAGFTRQPPATAGPVVGRGSYVEAVQARARETYEGYVEHGEAWFWPVVGTTMMIGFIVGRRGIFQNLPRYLPAVRRLAWWTGGLGLALAAAFATCSQLVDHTSRMPTVLGTLAGAFYVLNRPLLCAFYVCGMVLLSRKAGSGRWLAPLATVGRMPLTNYLMQSVIHSLIFYGYGLGYFGRVNPAVGVLVALGTFATQVVYSRLWMSRFAYGPMEWLWRALTYGKAPRWTVA